MMKIKFWNHFRAVPYLLFVGLLLLLTSLFTGFDPTAIAILGGGFALLFLPCLFLHVEYLAASAGLVLEITASGIVVTKGGKTKRKVPTEEITSIRIYKSPKLESGFVQIPTEYYFCARVITHNGPDIIITSLMANKTFDELSPLWKVKIENKRAIFPSINFPVVIPQIEA